MAALNDWQLQIGSLVLGPGTAYVVSAVDGFGKPKMRDGDSDRPLAHGGYFGRDWVGTRTVTLTVSIAGSGDPGTAQTRLDALLAEWQVSTPDTTTVKPLSFRRPGQPQRRWVGRPRRAAVTQTSPSTFTATLEYVCADPRIYDDFVTTLSTGLPAGGGGFTFPLTFPLTFGVGASGGLLVVRNQGTFATAPTVTITGPCANPAVWNDTTSMFLKTSLTLGDDDTVVIDFDQRSVTFDGAQRWGLTSDSSWWSLQPGTSVVRFSADVPNTTARMSIAWRSAWIG